LSLASTGRAQFVAGQVTDSRGLGIEGVELQFSNGVTPAGAVSGIGGFFNVAVPASTYDIGFIPPDDNLAPQLLTGIQVSGATNLGVITLADGFLLEGRVEDRRGNPVAGGNIDVFEAGSSTKVFAPGDGIDSFGMFDVVLPAGVYELRIKPPGGVLLVAKEVGPIEIAADRVMRGIVLEDGFLVTGSVVDSNSLLPLADVDLDVDDQLNGGRLLTPNDNSDSLGKYSLILPKGLFQLSFDPPPGSRHAGKRIENVFVVGSRDLGTTSLVEGVLLAGTVKNLLGSGVPRCDIDLLRASDGQSTYISNDVTDQDGNFIFAIEPGAYRLRAELRLSERLLVGESTNFIVAADGAAPPIELDWGVLLNGKIEGFDGQPEAAADIDLVDPGTGQELAITGDDTDASGHYAVIVRPGIWNLRLTTREGSLSRSMSIKDVVIASDQVINHRLPLVPVYAQFQKPIWLTETGNGSFMVTLVSIASLSRDLVGADISLVMVASNGSEFALIPPTTLLIPGDNSAFANPYWVSESLPLNLFVFRLPSVPQHLLGGQFRVELRLNERGTGEEIDKGQVEVIIS
jgi:hypothetical protein